LVSERAPFIPPAPDRDAIPPAPWRVLRVPGFLPLFGAQFVSSLGDWIGLFAILAIAARVSKNSAAAVGFVMVARMLPGFLFAPLGGALIDRWNRKVVMVSCDIGRFGLLVLLPFWENIWGLVVLSFAIEMLTLLWGPAKDATVPNIVTDPEQLASANSLGLVAAFGTFPIGAVMFAALAGIAHWLGGFHALSPLGVKQQSLAIWVDGCTFLVSALLISRLRLDEGARGTRTRVPASQTWREIKEGLSFIRANPLVRGVMIGLAGGLIGGGAIVPLGPTVATGVLHGGPASFGLLMAALGTGAAIGVITLLWLQRRLPRQLVFTTAIVTTGVAIIAVASMSSLLPAFGLVAALGAGAGCAYVTGFTMLQESVADDMRGRTFATLYTIVRLCLLLSLTIWPFIAGALNAISVHAVHGHLHFERVRVALPGVRLALWLGGFVTVMSGLAARRRMRRARTVADEPLGEPAEIDVRATEAEPVAVDLRAPAGDPSGSSDSAVEIVQST
jgi:dTMP kinase